MVNAPFESDAADETPTTAYHLTGDVLQGLPFGTHSHWLQPWRAACDTVPAEVVARGSGVGLDNVEIPFRAETATLLARAGFGLVRFGIGWGDVDFETESRLLHHDSVQHTVRACRVAGLRPLILLDAHHGRPVPAKTFNVRTVASAAKGAHTIDLASTEGIVAGRSGLSGLTDDGVMASVLVSGVSREQVRLAKRLPVALDAGQVLTMSTMRYAPFWKPGTPANEATMAGWLRYVNIVADCVGVRSSTADRGFDLEIWNELTFGSNFLLIENYRDVDPASPANDGSTIWAEIVDRTATHVASDPARFAGVALTNGFSNTIPWTASSQQPKRVSAISKHPYPPRKHFPADDRPGQSLGPDGQPTRFVPRYSAFFPEYYATAIQTETLWRDVAATPNPIYGTEHGRLARHTLDGAVAPVSVWITELGVDPSELGITDPQAADRLRAKYCLRSLLFYLGIGVSRVYWFKAFGNGTDFGLINTTGETAQTNSLRVLARALAAITDGGRFAGPVCPLRFELFTNDATTEVFSGGDGVAPLRQLDCLVLLPFQSSEHRIVVAYYIMTRDVGVDLKPQEIRVGIQGLPGDCVSAKVLDPVSNTSIPAPIIERGTERFELRLTVTDTPRLLLLQMPH